MHTGTTVPVRATPRRRYNHLPDRPSRPEGRTIIDDRASYTTTQDPAEAIFDGSTDLRLVRLRLFLALVTMFAIPIAIAAPVVYGLASRRRATSVVAADRRHPRPRRACSAACTVWLARRVLEPAERLDRARVILEDAYDRARAESLRDSLTGLGNHRAFQEELERQWVGSAQRHQQPLRPGDRRPRRLPADQRAARATSGATASSSGWPRR